MTNQTLLVTQLVKPGMHGAVFRDLLMLFITPEIMRWSYVCATFEEELRSGSGTNVFTSETEHGNRHWTDLKIRTVEHV